MIVEHVLVRQKKIEKLVVFGIFYCITSSGKFVESVFRFCYVHNKSCSQPPGRDNRTVMGKLRRGLGHGPFMPASITIDSLYCQIEQEVLPNINICQSFQLILKYLRVYFYYFRESQWTKPFYLLLPNFYCTVIRKNRVLAMTG